MPNIDLSILNQRQTPAFYASSLATRPAFGFAGRIFIDTDSPSTGLYRDTGTSWVQIADPGAGTTGTLQQVTTNGNTTTQGINIIAGGLSSNIVTLATNGLGSTANYIGQTMATNDNWKIYGTGSVTDQGELVFQVGDNGQPIASNGQRFRFSYDPVGGGGSAKDVLIIDYDLSYFNTSLGINTPTPGAAIDAHSSANIIAQLNQTTATNNSLLAFQNSGAGLWRIGNFYNGGANDLGIFDVIGNIQPVTVKKTTGQVLIGTSTVGSGKLVVASATGDNGIQIVGATAPSLRIDSAESGPTKRAGLGISTATNNFIQGSADRDFCMFNGSTTASPILFGIYDTTNVQEAARISAARNLLVGTTTDAGQKLQVGGNVRVTGGYNGTTGTFDTGSTVIPGFIVTGGGNSVGGGKGNIRSSDSGGGNYWDFGRDNLTTGNFVFSNLGSSPLMSLTTITGNLLIGTTTDAGQKLQVNGTALIGSTINTGSTGSIYSLIQRGSTPTGSQGLIISAGSGNTPNGSGITLSDNANSGGTIYLTGNSSDLYGGGISLVAYGQSSTGNIISFYTRSAANTVAERMRIKSNGVINIASIPTSAAGLSSGDIYSNAGILTIVP